MGCSTLMKDGGHGDRRFLVVMKLALGALLEVLEQRKELTVDWPGTRKSKSDNYCLILCSFI